MHDADLEKQDKINKAIHFSLSLTAMPLCCQNRQRRAGRPVNAHADTHSVCSYREAKTALVERCAVLCFFLPCECSIKVGGDHTSAWCAQRQKDPRDESLVSTLFSHTSCYVSIFKAKTKKTQLVIPPMVPPGTRKTRLDHKLLHQTQTPPPHRMSPTPRLLLPWQRISQKQIRRGGGKKREK